MTQLNQFCRIIKERSEEHRIALRLLLNNRLYGQAVAILRQELDSFVRVIYLLSLESLSARQELIKLTLENKKWTLPNSKTLITDRHMVDFSYTLHGWARSVYKLGCAFIHLSPLIDYKNENPFLKLEENERNDIKQHLNSYHGFPLENELTMESIIPYLGMVFDKISGNLASDIEDLENEKINCL